MCELEYRSDQEYHLEGSSCSSGAVVGRGSGLSMLATPLRL